MPTMQYLKGMGVAFSSMCVAVVLWLVQTAVIGAGQELWIMGNVTTGSAYDITGQLQIFVYIMMGFSILIALGGIVYAYRSTHEKERSDWEYEVQ